MLTRRDFLATSSAAALSAGLSRKADAASPAAAGEWRNKQSGMAYRRLGRTGFMVSEMVMGGNTISPDSYEHVIAAVDRGLNYLDTAAAYGRGSSERGFAKVIQARGRDKVFVNTKVSDWDNNRTGLYQEIFKSLPEPERKKLETKVEDEVRRTGVLEYDYIGMYNAPQPAQIRSAVLANLMEKEYGRKIDRRKNYYQFIIDSIERSLRNLETDHLDVMTCPHGASTAYELLNYPEIFEAFETLKKAGKVRHLSVSAHNDPAGVIEAALETGQYSMAMVAYNIVNHRWVDNALEKAKKNDFGVISMKAARPVYDSRKGHTVDPARVELIRKAISGPLSIPRKAYLWNLRNPNLSAIISNMENLQHVLDNLPLAGRKT